MKVLPCDTCGDAAQLPGGEPYVIGRTPDGIAQHPFKVRCAKCKHITTFTAAGLNRLPEITLAELDGLGLGHLARKDLEGAGLTKEQADQVIASGATIEELHPESGTR